MVGFEGGRGGGSLSALAADVDRRTAPLDPSIRARDCDLVAGLDNRFAAITACGLGGSLVHGDFHAGNIRSDGASIVLLDWGDYGVGHPLLDEAAVSQRLSPALANVSRDTFGATWRRSVPGSHPRRAVTPLQPVAALRQAVIHRGFLDHIEPDDQPFHRGDPARWIARAVEPDRPTQGKSSTRWDWVIIEAWQRRVQHLPTPLLPRRPHPRRIRRAVDHQPTSAPMTTDHSTGPLRRRWSVPCGSVAPVTGTT